MNEVADCIEHNTDAVREDIVKMVADIPVAVRLKGYSASELQLNTREEILLVGIVYNRRKRHECKIEKDYAKERSWEFLSVACPMILCYIEGVVYKSRNKIKG